MMTMSRALSAGQAKAYYQSEYSNAQASYYTGGERVEGEWAGTLAAEMGLAGTVERAQFERLMEGQDPRTGEQLVRHVTAKEYTNEYGKTVRTSEHRAGWDATYSAPKSVSIAAIIGGDKRLIQAHRNAVDFSLSVKERTIQARLGGNTPAQTTGKMIATKFEHHAARPDAETGYAAPQLHTHVLIANLTRTEGGRSRPLQALDLFRDQPLDTAIYRARLAVELQRLGYEIEIDPRTGAPELKGFCKEYLHAASPRSAEIERKAAAMKTRLEEQGFTVKEGAGLNQAAARSKRQSKSYDREEMRRRHEELDARFDYGAKRVVERALQRDPVELVPHEVKLRAQESVTFARDHQMEREAVAGERKIKIDALRRNLGRTTYEAVMGELNRRLEQGEFVSIIREDKPRQMTTQRMLKMESANIRRVLDGRGKAAALTNGSAAKEIGQLIAEAAMQRGVTLNESQAAAVTRILTSQDRIMGLQGGAGTGKTTALATVRQIAEAAGYEVKGFATTKRAVKQLAESGIETETLQKFIHRPEERPVGRTLYVLDESSLVGTRQVERFFGRLGDGDKTLLVGDIRQHQAIEAGSPFEQFQQHGMPHVKLDRVIRQREPHLRQVVEQLSAKQVREAVNNLQAQGRVIEVTDERERLQAIAAAYVAQASGTLVISPANKERVAINTMIHRRLQKEHVISPQDHSTRVYVNRQEMTGAERAFAQAYVPGEDIIRYSTKSKVHGVKAGDYGRVTAVDQAANTITVQLESGREITYDPKRLKGVNVYKETERKFTEGDRVQFRAPLEEHRVASGELGTIKQILLQKDAVKEGKQFVVELDEGRTVKFDGAKYRHLDHGYAVTSYSSQGETVDRVILNANTAAPDVLLNQRMGYVAISRARDDVLVFTNSAEELGAALDRQVDKQMAMEAVKQARACRVCTAQHSARHSAARTPTLTQEAAHKPTEHSHAELKAHSVVEKAWLPVTAADPCPVCHKPDNCSVVITEASGEKEKMVEIFCRRIESDRPGGGGWMHAVPDGADATRCEFIGKVEQNQPAPVEQRHAVMERLNELLKLNDRDRANLRERGLDDATITRYDYKSVPTRAEAALITRRLVAEGYDLTNVPGFYRPDPDKDEWRMNVNRWHSGFMVPVLDVEGRIQGQQIRRAEVSEEKKEARYVWFSSANKAATSEREEVLRHDGASSGTPVHYRNPELMRSTGEAILTEGVLKADVIAHYLDRGVIGVAGVGNFPKEFGGEMREQIPELKQVMIAYDADVVRNPQVQLHLAKLHKNLAEAGLEVKVLTWEESRGKGLDDYLKNTLGENFAEASQWERADRQREVLAGIGSSEVSRVALVREHKAHSQGQRTPEISW